MLYVIYIIRFGENIYIYIEREINHLIKHTANKWGKKENSILDSAQTTKIILILMTLCIEYQEYGMSD